MSAPKLTEAQREELEKFCCSETNRCPSNQLIELGCVEFARVPLDGRITEVIYMGVETTTMADKLVSKALDTTIRDFGTMPDTTGWQARHLREVTGYIGRKPTAAQAIIRMLAALAAYADCHAARCGATIGDDGIIGSAWLDSLRGVRAMLNGETGQLDCGTVDATICAMARAAGFEGEL